MVGVDVASDTGQTVMTIATVRWPFWWEKLLFNLRLKKRFDKKLVKIETRILP